MRHDATMAALAVPVLAILAWPAIDGFANEWRIGAQVGVSAPSEHDNGKYEPSSQPHISGALFGERQIAPWLDVQVRLSGIQERAHGYHQEEVTGDHWAALATVGPVLRWPSAIEGEPSGSGAQARTEAGARSGIFFGFTPYLRAGVGPAWVEMDRTRSSVTGAQSDRSGLEFAAEAAVGVERRLSDNLSVRLEGGHAWAGPMRDWVGGLALVYSWGGGDE